MHYHVTGYWAEDNADNYAPHTLASAVADMGERASLFADYETDSSSFYGGNADTIHERIEQAERYPRSGVADPADVRQAMNAYRDAWRANERAETYSVLALNCQRFDNQELLDRMRRMGADAVETSMLFSMGLIDGHNGYRVNTGDLEAYECFDPTCVSDYAEYLRQEAGWTETELAEWAEDLL